VEGCFPRTAHKVREEELIMAHVSKFTVVPRLPKKLENLMKIANNIWWCWDPEAVNLFFRIDRDLWTDTHENPRRLLGEVSQERLEELAKSDSFLAHMNRVWERMNGYMTTNVWRDHNPTAPEDMLVAYMSMEFGLHESICIYSGGLGVLAGDHLKAASDLGMPLVGIGLLYREGYFRQYLNSDGWQQELYPKNDFYNMPIMQERDKDGKPIVIEVDYDGHMVKAYIWRCQVGRVPLYLLDCDHEDNAPVDRAITAQLYGGDRETRIRQEIMIGMGGVVAMQALGIQPSVYHMNEGHAAFMALQRVRNLVQKESLSFHEAIETVKAGSVFTTHTPVPAGNDMFEQSLVEKYFQKYCHDVGISIEDLLPLGRQNATDKREPFCMTVLALKLSAGANGVAKLHGEVSRSMWAQTWKGVPQDEVPITSVTNGIHTRSWISQDLADLYDRYLGPGWINSPDDQSIWEGIVEVPDTELWRTHERRRERLVNFARRRLSKQLENRGAPSSERRMASEVLDPETLTIGFARRFATYKRATLILKDPDRLRAILCHPQRPVQLIIAGKAHPQDSAGKEIIRQLVAFSREPEIRGHVLFLEDYDINVARYMVQGVDCWLNTPRRPMEASGTSGMKASANGALNISIPDGWWPEAVTLGENGWNIGNGESYDTTEEQDFVESEALYDLLEKEVAPIYYDRASDGLPREWIYRMKEAIRTICPIFSTYRMVQEYTDRCYIPCAIRRDALRKNDRERALTLAKWKARINGCWSQVHVVGIASGVSEGLPVGSTLDVTADVHLGDLNSDDVTVEVFHGHLDPEGQIPKGDAKQMECVESIGDGKCRFKGGILCEKTGQLGFTVRIIPSHPDLAQKHETCLIVWG
jgi:glycogen phosphorylase